MRLALALILPLAACVDMVDDPANESSTTQASSEFDACAYGTGIANALIYEPPDFYKRSDYKINQTCQCKDWQVDMNLNGETHADAAFPLCKRRNTIAGFSLHQQQLGYRLIAEVPSWTVDDKTMCENSTFTASVHYWNGSSYVQLASTDTAYPSGMHPVWTNGTCVPLSWSYGPVAAGANVQLRTKAIRGLELYNHGYEGVKLSSQPW